MRVELTAFSSLFCKKFHFVDISAKGGEYHNEQFFFETEVLFSSSVVNAWNIGIKAIREYFRSLGVMPNAYVVSIRERGQG